MGNISEVHEPVTVYGLANKGVSKSDFLSFVAESGLNLTEFSALLPVSKRTIEKVKDADLLSPQVSDRLLSLISLYQFGDQVLGDKEHFKLWLKTPILALSSKRPLDFLNNETGISLVRDLLGRLEHGVYS